MLDYMRRYAEGTAEKPISEKRQYIPLIENKCLRYFSFFNCKKFETFRISFVYMSYLISSNAITLQLTFRSNGSGIFFISLKPINRVTRGKSRP